MPDSDLSRRIRALFLEELDDALEVLSRTVVTLGSAHRAGRVEVVRELFRTAHSVKGAAQAAGATEVMHAAHRLEDRFGAVRDGEVVVDDALVAELLGLVDDLAAARDAELDAGAGTAEPPTVDDPAPGGEPGTAHPSGAPAPRHSRIETAKLDALLDHTHELAALAAQLSALVQAPAGRPPGWPVGPAEDDPARLGDLARAVQRLSTELAATATSLTFLPFEAICQGLSRTVHDAADAAGKLARLEVSGGSVEADRAVLGMLRDPLLQLVGNAVAHGIEAPEDRRAAGKVEQGTVTVAAALDEGSLVVTVRDDGAGLDPAALRRAADQRGIPDDAELWELAFAPGVSTARTLTESAGRGVGLDVVRSGAQALGGSVRLASIPGEGTVATISVPATLALLRCLRAEAGDASVLVPLNPIERIVRCDAASLTRTAGRLVVLVDEVPVPVGTLAASAGIGDPGPLAGSLLLLVVESGAGPVALAVDALHEELDIAVRPAPARLAALDELLGVATAWGAGLPVLNLVVCARHALEHPDDAARPGPHPPRPVRVLVVDDTVTTRTLEAGVLVAAGYDVLTAEDGEAAWDLLLREAVDVVLTDVHMPRLDGIALTRRIRASDHLAELPVVIVSSLGSTEDRQAGLEAGATAYLVKADFDHRALVELIESVR